MIKQITILLVVVLVVGAVAFYGGWRYRGQVNARPVDNSAKIDSFKTVANVLEDSIRVLNLDRKTAKSSTVVYRTKYDTIRPKEDFSELILGLTQIANTPIK